MLMSNIRRRSVCSGAVYWSSDTLSSVYLSPNANKTNITYDTAFWKHSQARADSTSTCPAPAMPGAPIWRSGGMLWHNYDDDYIYPQPSGRNHWRTYLAASTLQSTSTTRHTWFTVVYSYRISCQPTEPLLRPSHHLASSRNISNLASTREMRPQTPHITRSYGALCVTRRHVHGDWKYSR